MSRDPEVSRIVILYGQLAYDEAISGYVTESPRLASTTCFPSAIAVGATATLIPGSNLTGRKGLSIKNNGTELIYVGTSAVTVGTGYPVYKKQSTQLAVGDDVNVYAISPSAGQDVRTLEVS